MSTRRKSLTKEEIAAAFAPGRGTDLPPVLSPRRFADATGMSVKTIYEWLAKDRFYGAYRKRGKHVFIWRDRALGILFNGKDWSSHE